MKEKLKRYFAKEILSYLSSEDEQLLYVGKPAGIILIPRFVILAIFILLGYTALHIIALMYFGNILAFIIGATLLIALSIYFALFMALDWLFDFYIVTNKKIIDVHFAPPMSHNLSTILLDQVRCTEVDTQKNGFLHELLDFGDVTVTFDRPTHQEAFIFHNINHPEQVSLYLGRALTSSTKELLKPFWYKTKISRNRLIMGEDLSSPLAIH